MYHSTKSSALCLITDVPGMSLTRLGKPADKGFCKSLLIFIQLLKVQSYFALEQTTHKSNRNPLWWQLLYQYPADIFRNLFLWLPVDQLLTKWVTLRGEATYKWVWDKAKIFKIYHFPMPLPVVVASAETRQLQVCLC